jgi:hypothetical protein
LYTARNPQQFERAAEFWGRHTLGARLVDEKSLAALAGAIDAVEGKPTFGLEHIQAFTMRHLPGLRATNLQVSRDLKISH